MKVPVLTDFLPKFDPNTVSAFSGLPNSLISVYLLLVRINFLNSIPNLRGVSLPAADQWDKDQRATCTVHFNQN